MSCFCTLRLQGHDLHWNLFVRINIGHLDIRVTADGNIQKRNLKWNVRHLPLFVRFILAVGKTSSFTEDNIILASCFTIALIKSHGRAERSEMKVLNTSRRKKNTRGNWKIKSAYTTNKLTASPTGRAHSRRVKYTKSNIKICMNISHRTCDQNIKCIWPPKLAVYRSGSILNTILSRKTYNYYEHSIGFKYSIKKKYKIGGN